MTRPATPLATFPREHLPSNRGTSRHTAGSQATPCRSLPTPRTPWKHSPGMFVSVS